MAQSEPADSASNLDSDASTIRTESTNASQAIDRLPIRRSARQASPMTDAAPADPPNRPSVD